MGAGERGEEGGRGGGALGEGKLEGRWAGAEVGGGWVSGLWLLENLNKLQRERNSVSFCLISLSSWEKWLCLGGWGGEFGEEWQRKK